VNPQTAFQHCRYRDQRSRYTGQLKAIVTNRIRIDSEEDKSSQTSQYRHKSTHNLLRKVLAFQQRGRFGKRSRYRGFVGVSLNSCLTVVRSIFWLQYKTSFLCYKQQVRRLGLKPSVAIFVSTVAGQKCQFQSRFYQLDSGINQTQSGYVSFAESMHKALLSRGAYCFKQNFSNGYEQHH
jgi:hypothetical protein